jgi:hypothetical protein
MFRKLPDICTIANVIDAAIAVFNFKNEMNVTAQSLNHKNCLFNCPIVVGTVENPFFCAPLA